MRKQTITKWTRKLINEHITSVLWDRGYGRGWSYDIVKLIGDDRYQGTLSELRKTVQPGQTIQIEAKKIGGHGTWHYVLVHIPIDPAKAEIYVRR